MNVLVVLSMRGSAVGNDLFHRLVRSLSLCVSLVNHYIVELLMIAILSFI